MESLLRQRGRGGGERGHGPQEGDPKSATTMLPCFLPRGQESSNSEQLPPCSDADEGTFESEFEALTEDISMVGHFGSMEDREAGDQRAQEECDDGEEDEEVEEESDPEEGNDGNGSHTTSGNKEYRPKQIWLRPLVVPALAGVALQLDGCKYIPQQINPKMIGLNCKWPACRMTCDPCPEKRVGRCVSKMLGADLRYMCQTNMTECMVGRCLCGQGFCAGPWDTKGISEADPSRQRSCVKQLCYPGARPPKDIPGVSATLMASFVPSPAFRAAFQLQNDYIAYVIYCSLFAAAMLIFGLSSAIALCLCLCAGHGVFQGACGFQARCWCWGTKHTTCDCVDLPTDEGLEDDWETLPLAKLESLKPDQVATLRPLVRATTFMIVLCIVSVAVRMIRAASLLNSLQAVLIRFNEDIGDLRKIATIASGTMHSVGLVLDRIQNECFLTDPVLTKSLKDLTRILKTEKPLFAAVNKLLSWVPGVLHWMYNRVEDLKPIELWGPVLPQLVVGVFCVAITIPALLSIFTSRTNRYALHTSDLALLVLGILTSFIMILAAVVAAAELAVGTALSVVCVDLDHYVMSYVNEFSPNILVTNTARHYVVGDVYNPLEELVDTGTTIMNQVDDLYDEFRLVVGLVGMTCLPIFSFKVLELTATARGLLAQGRALVSAESIWPYYKTIAQDMVCHDLTSTIGFSVFFQVAICLILFPMTMIHIHHLFVRKEEMLAEEEMIERAISKRRFEMEMHKHQREPEPEDQNDWDSDWDSDSEISELSDREASTREVVVMTTS